MCSFFAHFLASRFWPDGSTSYLASNLDLPSPPHLEFPELLVVVAVAEVEVGELSPEGGDQQQLPAVRGPQRASLVLDGVLLRKLGNIKKMPIRM